MTDDLREKAREWLTTDEGHSKWQLQPHVDSLTDLLREVQRNGLGYEQGRQQEREEWVRVVKEEKERHERACRESSQSFEAGCHNKAAISLGQVLRRMGIKEGQPRCTQDDGTPWPTKYGCGGEKCGDCEP